MATLATDSTRNNPMNLSSVRPDVSEIQFHLFDRAIHPELLHRHQGMSYRFAEYRAQIAICDAGHVLVFSRKNKVVTEVLSPVSTSLPQYKKLFQHNLAGCRDHKYEFGCSLTYQNSCQTEQVDPEVYLQIHEELVQDSRKMKMVCQFPSAHRFSPPSLSQVYIEAVENSFLIHTCHTFPENCSLVKTQSLFELDLD